MRSEPSSATIVERFPLSVPLLAVSTAALLTFACGYQRFESATDGGVNAELQAAATESAPASSGAASEGVSGPVGLDSDQTTLDPPADDTLGDTAAPEAAEGNDDAAGGASPVASGSTSSGQGADADAGVANSGAVDATSDSNSLSPETSASPTNALDAGSGEGSLETAAPCVGPCSVDAGADKLPILDQSDAALGSALDSMPLPEIDAAPVLPEGGCWPSSERLCAPCAEVDGCEVLTQHLLHRYEFSGTGNLALDSVADHDGEIVGTELGGQGQLKLSGTGDYVELPAGVLGDSNSLSIEIWLQWHGGDAWQRIFDFGNRIFNEPRTYIYLTPRSNDEQGAALTASYSTYGSDQATRLTTSAPLVTVMSQVVVVLDGDNDRLQIYVDAELQAESDFDLELSRIVDNSNLIGRSLFGDDPDLDATLDEFRIYDAALSAEQIARSLQLGPEVSVP